MNAAYEISGHVLEPEETEALCQATELLAAKGALVVLECEDPDGIEAMNSLPESYTELHGGHGLPIAYYQSPVACDSVALRKPLPDDECEKWVEKVLASGLDVLNAFSLPPLLSLRVNREFRMGGDGRPRAGWSRPVHKDLPVEKISFEDLMRKLEAFGTTEDEQKTRIVELAKARSPEFKIKLERAQSRPLEDAPWHTELWKTIVAAVPVSAVYAHFGETMAPSESGLCMCLVCHASGEDLGLHCIDDREWECSACGGWGDSFFLFHQRRGTHDENKRSRWNENSRAFSALAGVELSEEWHDYLDRKDAEQRAALVLAQLNVLPWGEKKLHELNEIYFVAKYKNKIHVVRESLDTDGNFKLETYTPQDFESWMSDETIPALDSKGEPIQKRLAKVWMGWPLRRKYDAVIFYPGDLSKRQSRKFYNLWKGFEVEPCKGTFPRIEHHLKNVWCCGNEEHYRYLLLWFAHLLQFPAEKPGIALVIKGKKGTGKSTIFEGIFEKILGGTYSKIDTGEQATGKFNHHLRGKLLLVLEEAIWAGSKAAEGRVKSMITDSRAMYEPKGVDAFEEASYMRLAFVSNEKRAVPASLDERRYFALKVSTEHQCDVEYFRALREEIDNGGREAFMDFLLNYPVDRKAIRTPPRSPALWDDIYEGLSLGEKWLYDSLNTRSEDIEDEEVSFLWQGNVRTRLFFDDFSRYREERSRMGGYMRSNDITSQKKMTMFLDEFFGYPKVQHKKQRCFAMPGLEAARRDFERQVRCEVPWDDIVFAKQGEDFF